MKPHASRGQVIARRVQVSMTRLLMKACNRAIQKRLPILYSVHSNCKFKGTRPTCIDKSVELYRKNSFPRTKWYRQRTGTKGYRIYR